MPFGLSYYLFPLVSAVVWIGTLLGLLIYWLVNGRPVYSSMANGQTIAYISDVGAQLLKPLFIAGSATTVVLFDSVFIFEKWLRHRGRLAPHTSKGEKAMAYLSCIFSIIGAAGLILLSIFDTLRHPRAHQGLLLVFIVGYLFTAIFVCAEYQRLGIHQRRYSTLAKSFWLKLAWVFIFVILAIAFGVTQRVKMYNTAAILEWVIGFIFGLFVASFAVDFLPAIHTRGSNKGMPRGNQMEEAQGRNGLGGPADYASDASYGSGQPMSNGRYNQPASRNF